MRIGPTTIAATIAAAAAASGTAGAPNAAPATVARGCTAPRLYALTVAAAAQRIQAAGCRLGPVAHERPSVRPARVTGQVPLPGAVLPPSARVAIVVS